MTELKEEKSNKSIFVSKELLEELTGYKAPYKQIEWLTRKNYPFEVNGANHPKLLMEVMFSKLGSPSTKTIEDEPKQKWKLDLSKLT
ncbi:DUF4224 domain-containing protein [Entomomonas asaccharolytica]|uniref:DUF4224 domain-containing protein n=1 Tax=Entomomonas asaccharolytica TaxID=2785331 RepID=A0A974NEC4_9GAMM|nr:DUF4224 domain-containing protein [Entomomonas asaccharolytica]QQP85045.1 DUF4224 domain-containing protein [Entomomonas asaccharolytica]